jgi:hypothetical protein
MAREIDFPAQRPCPDSPRVEHFHATRAARTDGASRKFKYRDADKTPAFRSNYEIAAT